MIYTRSQLRSAVNRRIFNKIGVLADPNATLNDAVREVVSLVDMRSMKRRTPSAPNLFRDIYQYSWPADAKGHKVIGIQPQNMERYRPDYWNRVGQEEFDQYKQTRYNLISFSDSDGVRKLLASVDRDLDGFTPSGMSALTGAGTWTAFGDATNLRVDSDDWINGNGSIKFDLTAAGGTTAGIVATDVPTFDLTKFASAGSAFVWAGITSITGITNYKLRLGNSSSNYYEMTATVTNEGLPFATGWNLLRFDFSGKTTTGTVTLATCSYVALYMTKLGSKISETDYRFNYLLVKRGNISNLLYYSKYAWQTALGAYLENATDDTDLLNADTDEYNLFLEKAVEWAADEAREPDASKKASAKFEVLLKKYKKDNKSEALPLLSTYHDF